MHAHISYYLLFLSTFGHKLIQCFRSVKGDLESVDGRKTKYATISGSVELDILWIPLKSSSLNQSPSSSSSRTTSTSSLSSSSSSTSGLSIKTKCVVSVFIYSANNLAHYTSIGGTPVPIPVGYLPSAQVSCYK